MLWRLWLLVVPDGPTKGQGHLLSCCGQLKMTNMRYVFMIVINLWPTFFGIPPQQAVCWLAAASAGKGGYSVHCSLLTEEIQTSRCIIQCNCDAMHWKSVLLRRGTQLVPLVVVQTVSLLERGQNKMYLSSNFEAANKTMFSLILGTRTKIETGKSSTAFYIHI